MKGSFSLADESDSSSSSPTRRERGGDDWKPGYDREVWVSSSEELPTFDPVRAREAFSMMPDISSPVLPNGPSYLEQESSRPLSIMMDSSNNNGAPYDAEFLGGQEYAHLMNEEEDVVYISSSESATKKRVLPEFMSSGWKRPIEEKKPRRVRQKKVAVPEVEVKSVEELLEECLARERKRDAILELDEERLKQERRNLQEERRSFEDDKDSFLRRMMIRTAMYARSSAESSVKSSTASPRSLQDKEVQRQAARNFYVLASNPDQMMDRFANDVRYPLPNLLEQEKSTVTKILAGQE